MKVAIATDDNAHFPDEETKRSGLFVVPMPIIVDGQERYEGPDFNQDQFFALQTSGHDMHTSQPTPGNVMGIWDRALAEADQVLYVPMSSGLTQAVNTAKMLAADDKYVGKVFVVDNHRISVTLRDSIYDALALAKAGQDAKGIQDYLEKTSHESKIYIMVDTLKYLVKGGRVTPSGAALGGLLHIKPILKIEGGKLDAKAKAVGTKMAEHMMINFIAEDVANFFKGIKDHLSFGMAYTADRAKALDFRNQFAQSLGIDPTSILADPLSLSIAVHIGPGALAVTVSRVVDETLIKEAERRQLEEDNKKA